MFPFDFPPPIKPTGKIAAGNFAINKTIYESVHYCRCSPIFLIKSIVAPFITTSVRSGTCYEDAQLPLIIGFSFLPGLPVTTRSLIECVDGLRVECLLFFIHANS